MSGGCGDEATAELTSISGHAFKLTYTCQRLPDTQVCLYDDPNRCVTTAADGAWRFDDVETGKDVYAVLQSSLHHPVQTGTFNLGKKGIDRVTFQAVDLLVWAVFEMKINMKEDPQMCQISTTVTEVGESLYTCTVHGEKGATVTIDPPLPAKHGPIYFDDHTMPDKALKQTSTDGGVVYINVPPGTYTLKAHKQGMSFESVKVTCRAGLLVNPSPPRGLQALP